VLAEFSSIVGFHKYPDGRAIGPWCLRHGTPANRHGLYLSQSAKEICFLEEQLFNRADVRDLGVGTEPFIEEWQPILVAPELSVLAEAVEGLTEDLIFFVKIRLISVN